MTHVRTVSRRLERVKRASRKLAAQVVADGVRRDHIVGALHDERRHEYRRQVRAIVGEERRLGEALRDDGIGGAEARLELARELRTIGILHDRGREKVRPPDVVLLHHLEQPLDVGALEAADVVRRIVDVARRGADHDEPLEEFGLAIRREHADHAAHGVADEDHVVQIELVANVEHVLRVALERCVALGVVRGEIGLSRADIVEEDDAVVVLERRSHEAPHVLVATEAVCEEHRLRALPEHLYVVATERGRMHRANLSDWQETGNLTSPAHKAIGLWAEVKRKGRPSETAALSCKLMRQRATT